MLIKQAKPKWPYTMSLKAFAAVDHVAKVRQAVALIGGETAAHGSDARAVEKSAAHLANITEI